jgi:hypothetical protein
MANHVEVSLPASKDKKQLDVLVFAPREVDPKSFSWEKTMKVGEAAREAAVAFRYEATTPTLQNKDSRVLDRNKPLVAEGVQDGDELELVDTGGGVRRAQHR